MTETLPSNTTEQHERLDEDSAAQLLLDTVSALTDRRHWLDDVNDAYNHAGRPDAGARLDVMMVGEGKQSRHVSIHWDRNDVAHLSLSGRKAKDIRHLPNAEAVDASLERFGVDSRAVVLPLLYSVLSRYPQMPGAANLIERAEALDVRTNGAWEADDHAKRGALFMAHAGRVLRVDTETPLDAQAAADDALAVQHALGKPAARTLLAGSGFTARLAFAPNAFGAQVLAAPTGASVEVQQAPNPRLEMAEYMLGTFVGNRGFDQLARLYDIELPSDPRERLATLQELAQQWDSRRGQERQAIDWGEGLDPRVEEAARMIGLVESSRPLNITPKVGLVLGAANKAPYDRLRYLQTVCDPALLAYAGSSRPVGVAEREKARAYALHPNDEFDLGGGAFRTVLGARLLRGGAGQRTGEDTRGWQEYAYTDRSRRQRQAFALSTPFELTDAGGKRRATTYDNLEAVATDPRLGLQAGDTVVQATTQIYAPAQHLVATEVLTLGHGIFVETVGHDAAFSGVTRTSRQYLQEIKAAVDAAVHLQAAIDAMAQSA